MNAKTYEISIHRSCPHGLGNILECGQCVVTNLIPMCALQELQGTPCPQIIVFDLAGDTAETAGLPNRDNV